MKKLIVFEWLTEWQNIPGYRMKPRKALMLCRTDGREPASPEFTEEQFDEAGFLGIRLVILSDPSGAYMRIDKQYLSTRFPSTVIADALGVIQEFDAETLRKNILDFENGNANYRYSESEVSWELSITRDEHGEVWTFDSLEEWYGAYDRGASSSTLSHSAIYSPHSFRIQSGPYGNVTVSVEAPEQRQVERVLRIFTTAAPDNQISMPALETPQPPPVVVFLGHGRSSDWREIKDHLQDSHHYKIEAYEVGARAGHSIRDVLETMLDRSSFALLVMTGEDENTDGGARARQNVVHEAGLFQGRLGFHRAIAVVENGVEVFSNLDGVQQIRYDPGNVRSTFGEILATLRREFADAR